MTADILDLIDAAVDDWETRGDAMRWKPDAENQPPAPRWPIPGDFLTDFARRFEEAVRQASPVFAATGVTFERATAAMGAFGSCLPEVRVLRDAMLDHDLRVGIMKAYRVRPHHLGIGDMGCFCHPAPFPAARDYRRRTRHRNRPRKR